MAGRPTLVYDDDCGFCTWCVEYALRRGAFDAVGFSELSDDQEARLPDDYERCAHLLTETAVYSCGRAVEEAMVRLDAPISVLAGLFSLLPESVRGPIRESLYRWAANHRDWLGRLRRRTPPARLER